ncbi:hypothetical protein pdam_00025973 [Pocillopora damicornis]|uniref:Uncharacterized protein n=1 Tax=Pocillopora damicornis TaxID=46731 RepID=A0A3M6TR54_POCDA|nr:hypothetical protein pdam_00025973 [Pocillopora damicornis]
MVLLIPPAPKRPGIVNFYIVHSVKVNGEFRQHAFAVVWWYKIDCDQGHFGKPTQTCIPVFKLWQGSTENQFM